MTHNELLETENKEQYNRYRWIGQMQSVVLTFYGAVATFSFLAINALRPQPSQQFDYRWLAGVLVTVGLLGCFTGIALFQSRSMQRRTAWCLTCLLAQMASAMDGWILEQSALRFRALCTGGPRIGLLNTMNTAFFIALVSGEAFLICGAAVFLVAQFNFAPESASIGGVGAFLIALVITPLMAQRYMDAETRRMTCDYFEAERARGLAQMQKKVGLPGAPSKE